MSYTEQGKIQVFLIGGGVNSAVGRAHIAGLALCPSVVISGACFSRNQEINYLSAEQFGINRDKLFNSMNEMIDSVEAGSGIFIVLTDTPSHSEISKLLVGKGHHLIVEKAHVGSVEEGVALESLLSESPVFYRCVFNYLGFNVLRAMKRLISEGIIGKILRCDGVMPQDSFVRLNAGDGFDIPQVWRQKDQAISTVSLDLGVHVVSAMRYVAGVKFENVVSVAGPKSRVPDVHSGYTAIYRDSESQVVGLIDYGKYNFGNRNGLSVKVNGESGALEWSLESPDELLFTDSSGTKSVLDKYSKYLAGEKELQLERFKVGHPTGFVEGLANLYSMFFEDYLHKNSDTWFCTISEANEILQTIGRIEGEKMDVI